MTSLLGFWAERRRGLSSLPGLSLGVTCGTERAWTALLGQVAVAHDRRGVPVADSTRFRIASISKVFTGIAVLQLRERGLLDLDDPVIDYLPWFRPANADRYPAVTVRHLLTHTSGLPTNSAATDFNRMTQPVADTMIARLGTQDLVLEPGSALKYSNLGFAVLGQLIEAVSGRSYGDWVKEEILAPLAMHRTVVHPAPGGSGVTSHHAREPDGTRRADDFIWLGAFTPAGGIATTAADMLAFARFLLAPEGARPSGEVLAAETRAEMARVHVWADSSRGGIGLAWAVGQSPGRHEIYHGGGLPTQTSHLQIDLENGLGVIALTNAMDGDASAYVLEALELLRFAISAGGCASAGGPGARSADEETPDLARYTGRYAWQNWQWWVLRLGDCLWLIDPVGLDHPLAGPPSRSAIRLDPLGEDRFRAASGWLQGETIRFESGHPDHAGADGPPIRMYLPAMFLRRIGPVSEETPAR